MSEKRTIRNVLRQLLLLDEPPERTARAYGFGVFLGFSPLIGFHTVLALVVIFVARVNRLALLAGVYSNTPWTLAPAAALGTGIGFWILGIDGPLPEMSRETITSGQLWSTVSADVWSLFLPFFVGNWLLAACAGFVAFFVAKLLLLRSRAGRHGGTTNPVAGE